MWCLPACTLSVSSHSVLGVMFLNPSPVTTHGHDFSASSRVPHVSGACFLLSAQCLFSAVHTVGLTGANIPTAKLPASGVGWFSSHRETAPLCAGTLGCSRRSQTRPHHSPAPQVICFSRASGYSSLSGMCLLRSPEPHKGNGKNANQLLHQMPSQGPERAAESRVNKE